MSFRTIYIESRSKLNVRMNYLCIRGENEIKIHLSEISTIIVDTTAASFTAQLLCELAKRKIKIIFCDEKHIPHGEMVSYFGSHDTSEKIKIQAKWKEGRKEKVWAEIVKLKIKKQMEHLRDLGLEEFLLLENYFNEVESGDESNREGHSAKVYFNALFGKSFSREGGGNINALLNYGYSILLSNFAKEIVASGYITQLGIHHRNEFNPLNLACDLMEPFRVIIDKAALELEGKELEGEERKFLIDQMNREVKIGGKKQTVMNGIKIYCKSVLDAMNDNGQIEIKEYEF